MSKAPFERPREPRRRDGATYTCADGTYISCGHGVLETEEEVSPDRNQASITFALRNGILLRPHTPPIAIVNETWTNRDMSEIIYRGPGKTYSLPNTITIVAKNAFYKNVAASVRLNEGLETLEESCFENSRIRRLILPASVESIGESAFEKCEHLESADLRAARGLKSIGRSAFRSCRALKEVLLNDGLERIGLRCFEESELEQVSIPGSVRHIDKFAFARSSLRQVRFLGAAERKPPCEDSSGDAKDNRPDNKQQPEIKEGAFAQCMRLRYVVFDPGSVVAEIKRMAFRYSGLESFTAPLSLRKIDTLAFEGCCNLKTFELNESIQELGWLCLWKTGITDLHIPPHIKMTREQLGLDQEDSRVLRLPHGWEVVGKGWFRDNDIEKVFIPSTVRELGEDAFCSCEKLCEVVFEPDSHLETIGDNCFSNCGFEEVTIPKSVRSIGRCAFQYCCNLRSLTFEEGSQLTSAGRDIVYDTQVDPKKVKFPSTLQVDRAEDTYHTYLADLLMRDLTDSEEW